MGSVGTIAGKSNLDFSSQGTYNFDGQKAPSGLKTFNGYVKGNPNVTWQGTTYQIQNVVDYDSTKNGEYVAGHLYVPNSSGKGSFFVSENNELYHDGSQYLRDKKLARAQGRTIEEYRNRRRNM